MGKQWQTILGGSKITADGDCSLEMKGCLLLERKVMTNLDSIFKSRDITLPTRVHLVKGMFFPVVNYACESWTVKKAESWRTDAFEVWCSRKLLRVPWTARRSEQTILKESSPRCSLEGLMLKLKLQYFGHLMLRADSFEKTLMLGKIEGRRRRGWQKMRWLNGIIDSMDLSLNMLLSWWWTGKAGVLRSMGLQSQTWLRDWTEPNTIIGFPRWCSGRESLCPCRSCRRCGLDPWVGKIPWRRTWQPLQYSCLKNPEEPGGLQSIWSQRVRHD